MQINLRLTTTRERKPNSRRRSWKIWTELWILLKVWNISRACCWTWSMIYLISPSLKITSSLLSSHFSTWICSYTERLKQFKAKRPSKTLLWSMIIEHKFPVTWSNFKKYSPTKITSLRSYLVIKIDTSKFCSISYQTRSSSLQMAAKSP